MLKYCPFFKQHFTDVAKKCWRKKNYMIIRFTLRTVQHHVCPTINGLCISCMKARVSPLNFKPEMHENCFYRNNYFQTGIFMTRKIKKQFSLHISIGTSGYPLLYTGETALLKWINSGVLGSGLFLLKL